MAVLERKGKTHPAPCLRLVRVWRLDEGWMAASVSDGDLFPSSLNECESSELARSRTQREDSPSNDFPASGLTVRRRGNGGFGLGGRLVFVIPAWDWRVRNRPFANAKPRLTWRPFFGWPWSGVWRPAIQLCQTPRKTRFLVQKTCENG